MQVAAENVKRFLELAAVGNIILEGRRPRHRHPAGYSPATFNSARPARRSPGDRARSRLAEVESSPPHPARASPPATRSRRQTGIGPLVPHTAGTRVRPTSKGQRRGRQSYRRRRGDTRGLDHGFFVQPTVLLRGTKDMIIARRESSAPFSRSSPYDTEEEAVEIANDSIIGLAGGVWAGDKEHAIEWRKLRTGQVTYGGPSTRLRLRRLQAVGQSPRARQVRLRGVPRGEVTPALIRLRTAVPSRSIAYSVARASSAMAETDSNRRFWFDPRGRTRSARVLASGPEGKP